MSYRRECHNGESILFISWVRMIYYDIYRNGGKIGKYIVLGSSQGKGTIFLFLNACLFLGLKGSLGLISMTAALGLGYYMNTNSNGAQA